MLTKEKELELKRFAIQLRMETIRCIASIGIGHVGGALSIAEVLAVLYGKQMKYDPLQPRWEGRDWLVVSKGHAGPAVYSALALKGYFSPEVLQTLNQPNTQLPSHCDRNRTVGIDITTGSLGQGASSAAGVAAALKLDKRTNRVFLIMGDGELDEGQVWEMAMFAAHRKLSNLTAFVDQNHLQLDGTTDEVCALGDIAEKFRAFGWEAATVNGHDVAAIDAAVEYARSTTDRPSVIVLDTVKGRGWSKVEGKVGSHNCTVTAEDAAQALIELHQELEAIEGEKQ